MTMNLVNTERTDKWTLRFYKMKEGFTFGENVTERDIDNHKKLQGFKPHEYLIVVADDEAQTILYTDGFDEENYE